MFSARCVDPGDAVSRLYSFATIGNYHIWIKRNFLAVWILDRLLWVFMARRRVQRKIFWRDAVQTEGLARRIPWERILAVSALEGLAVATSADLFLDDFRRSALLRRRRLNSRLTFLKKDVMIIMGISWCSAKFRGEI